MTPAGSAAAALGTSELAGAAVLDDAGRRVGRIRDVYLCDATGEIVAVAVRSGWVRSRDLLVHARRCAPGGRGRVRIPWQALGSAPQAPATGHVSEDLLASLP